MKNSICLRIFWASIAILPATLWAVDGTILIDQNHALAGGITAGDTPGFPVTISQPGSYRLSGNLTVPTADTTAIQITASNVTLDLNGFAILGPVTCTPSPASCPTAGKGIGIQSGGGDPTANPRNIRIKNGSVHGMGLNGLSIIGEAAFVEAVNADNNAGAGMIVAGTVTRSTASVNGSFGILAITVLDCTTVQNVGNGIVLDASGGVAIGNISSFNGGAGMVVPNGTVTGNTLVRNASFGISTLCPSSIFGNTVVSNTLGSIQQTNIEACVLVNNATRP